MQFFLCCGARDRPTDAPLAPLPPPQAAAGLDSSLPRRVNGQAVVLREAPNGKDLQVLLQLRSERMQVMPGHLAAIGGCCDASDPDSRATVLREVQEETGLRGGITIPPAKFAEGAKCDWYVMKVSQPVFEQAETEFECGDVKSVLPFLPASTSIAECYGHAWVSVKELRQIDEAKLPLMGGLLGRVNSGVKHLRKLEGQVKRGHNLKESSAEALQTSGIEISKDGSITACPREPAQSVGMGALRTQLEYYLSDDNLRTDRFFHEKISASDGGWLDMELVLNCKKIKDMNATRADIVTALVASVLEVRQDEGAIRRANNAPLPALQSHKGKGKSSGKGSWKGSGKKGTQRGAASSS
eukprot:TRINITY_DN32813_c0_g1_i1.p1 TRINITY_DN32813_c0_g1~~TRINITY_DN32813_c0_g1_i1.p1  ORF type:complete len:356 (-),score=87.93 TRINITY_DN32813_c0_g1_i1:46-1113(-)